MDINWPLCCSAITGKFSIRWELTLCRMSSANVNDDVVGWYECLSVTAASLIITSVIQRLSTQLKFKLTDFRLHGVKSEDTWTFHLYVIIYCDSDTLNFHLQLTVCTKCVVTDRFPSWREQTFNVSGCLNSQYEQLQVLSHSSGGEFRDSHHVHVSRWHLT